MGCYGGRGGTTHIFEGVKQEQSAFFAVSVIFAGNAST